MVQGICLREGESYVGMQDADMSCDVGIEEKILSHEDTMGSLVRGHAFLQG